MTTLAARVEALEARVADLERKRGRRRLRLDGLAAVIGAAVGPGVIFSTGDLWRYARRDDRLGAAFEAAAIRDSGALACGLRELRRRGSLVRVGRDGVGTLWAVDVDRDLHHGRLSGDVDARE